MSYVRFVWYKVQRIDGTETVHRWAENASHVEGRLTVEEYHARQGVACVGGPFKTRKEAENCKAWYERT